MSLRFKILITVCLLLCGVGQLLASTVIITGTVNKPSSQTVAIKYTSNIPNQDQAFVTANLDQHNSFYTQFDLHEFGMLNKLNIHLGSLGRFKLSLGLRLINKLTHFIKTSTDLSTILLYMKTAITNSILFASNKKYFNSTNTT